MIDVLSLLYNAPLAVDAGKLQLVARSLSDRMGIRVSDFAIVPVGAEAMPLARGTYEAARSKGISVINIAGSLVNRQMNSPSGATSYDSIITQLNFDAEDPAIRGGMLRIDSFGGQVSGMADMADAVLAFKAKKPLWAAANDNALSAAFLPFALADRRYVTRTSLVGSVGVIALHVDESEAMKKEGLKATLVTSGKHKGLLHGSQPLSEAGHEFLRAMVNESADLFIKYAALGLGISEDEVRQTEAAVFRASQAIENGFASHSGTFEQALAALIEDTQPKATLIRSTPTPIFRGGSAANLSKEQNMENPNPTAENNTPPPVNAAAVAADARARVKSILTSPEASGREALANHLAFDTDMTVSAAEGILKASPKATVAPAPEPKQEGKSEFSRAMEAVGNPGINAAGDTEADPETKRLTDAVAIYRQSKGLKPASAA
jgi:capsid assembly protease